MNTPSPDARTSGLKRWLIAVRPFSFPASVIPVLLGTALAVAAGAAPFHLPRFVLAVLAMMSLHAGANILGDINDFRRGLDKTVTPVSGAIVRGLISGRQALAGALTLLAAGSLAGLVLAWMTGPALLWIGVVGLIIGVSYTVPPLSLKYRALGDLAVFLNFGILGALGAWVVQTGTPSWIPALRAIPVALLVVAILHANNWRDITSDNEGRIKTVAALLGDRGSLTYYGSLLFGSFALVLLSIPLTRIPRLGPPMPIASAVVLLALPLALKLWRKALSRRAPANPTDFVALDGATAQLNLVFGLLYSAGVLAAPVLARWI